MRVALVVYGALKPRSGGFLYDLEVAEGLKSAGDVVRVVSMPPRSWAACLAHNLDPRWAVCMEHPVVDVVLQDELNHPSLLRANHRLGRRPGRPLLVSVVHHLRSCERHPPAALALYRSVERTYLRSVDACVYNSETTRREAENLAGPRPFVVAYPAGDRLGRGMAAEAVARRARDGGPLRVIFVGNVIRRKGLEHLIRALATLRPGSWRLSVAGDEDTEPATARAARALAARLGIEPSIRFLGRLGDAELGRELESHHVLAVPSTYEGFGIAYLEGMGFGLPAIAASDGGAAEIVRHGQNGYLVAPGDVAQLAGHLAAWDGDRGLLERMSLAALEHYHAQPGWSETAATVRSFLLRLLERGGT